ncbi:MAG: flagellar biosynthesis protein [Clostridiales Family XIII bacterium]|jgi:flagellar operon protein|nr:flagellar biosynthesis protein [Clostridiales Family XIII bacterium]
MSDQTIKGGYNPQTSIAERAARLRGQTGGQDARGPEIEAGSSFRELLSRRIEGERKALSFSKHADLRAKERNIAIETSDLDRLSEACDRAAGKGVRDALIVMNDSAFIVNAGSKVVVTVVDKNEMKDNIFTNIEGAVFL